MNKKTTTDKDENNIETISYLKWAIESRYKNQKSAVKLFQLLEKYPHRWKKMKYSLAARTLVGITFSLWRAAFLADKTDEKGKARAHAKEFLKRVIQDNAIGFSQDRTWNEWTFDYYTDYARLSLISLASDWGDEFVPSWKHQTYIEPMEEWDYAQKLLNITINRFKAHFEDEDSST